jgi:hypothetical protein
MIRNFFHKISPHLCRDNDKLPVLAIFKDGRISNEGKIFGKWRYLEDRFAFNGGYSVRSGWAIVQESDSCPMHVTEEDGTLKWFKVSGEVEFLQFKFKDKNNEYCTILGDLSRACVVEDERTVLNLAIAEGDNHASL